MVHKHELSDIMALLSYLQIFLCLNCCIVCGLNENKYKIVKSRDDESPLCAVGEPSRSVVVRSKLECLMKCQDDRLTCNNTNYRQDIKTCEIFHFIPNAYDKQTACTHYQVSQLMQLKLI